MWHKVRSCLRAPSSARIWGGGIRKCPWPFPKMTQGPRPPHTYLRGPYMELRSKFICAVCPVWGGGGGGRGEGGVGMLPGV